MRSFSITHAADPLKELEVQKEIIYDEITNRLLVPHQQQIEAYDKQMYTKMELDTDDDKKEHRLEILKRSEEQFRIAHTTEENVIRSLVTQIIHIVATEIINRRPSQVTCEYKNNLFIVPIRYKN